MEKPLVIYATFPDTETALAVGETLIERHLAACVNVLPGMKSVYRWHGKVERASEVVAIFKSRMGLQTTLMGAIRELHPYETPVIIALDVAEIDADTLVWLIGETSPGAGSV